MKRIGDILTRNKTPVVVMDGTTYKQVTIRTNYKGVMLRGTQDGSTIGTKNQFFVSAGQFILSRIDARNGAFGIIPDELDGAIVTNDFLAFDINEDEVERDFFNVFLQSPTFLEACIKASRGNTNRKRVDEDFFLNYKVNLPPLPEQHQLIKQINKGRTNIGTAQSEITRQQSLLAKLKQAILQEAIQGKLTADWRAAHPKVEPARQLLHRIQAEKSRLIAAKKLRQEKPLPTITADEIPFRIPPSWEWCRIAQATIAIIDCPHSTPQWTESGMTCVKTSQFQRFQLDLSTRFYVSRKTYDERVDRLIPQPGDILYSREGGILGIACRIPAGERLCLGQRMMLFRAHDPNVSAFLELMLNSPHVTKIADESTLGGCAPHINVGEIKAFPIPLPPLTEQVAIVERVEALMTRCRALEATIEHSRAHVAHLLQAVLQEAFSAQHECNPEVAL
jgi:type I restriction enzyme S subunit